MQKGVWATEQEWLSKSDWVTEHGWLSDWALFSDFCTTAATHQHHHHHHHIVQYKYKDAEIWWQKPVSKIFIGYTIISWNYHSYIALLAIYGYIITTLRSILLTIFHITYRLIVSRSLLKYPISQFTIPSSSSSSCNLHRVVCFIWKIPWAICIASVAVLYHWIHLYSIRFRHTEVAIGLTFAFLHHTAHQEWYRLVHLNKYDHLYCNRICRTDVVTGLIFVSFQRTPV